MPTVYSDAPLRLPGTLQRSGEADRSRTKTYQGAQCPCQNCQYPTPAIVSGARDLGVARAAWLPRSPPPSQESPPPHSAPLSVPEYPSRRLASQESRESYSL